MRYTVADARSEIALFAGETGICPDSPELLGHLNAARRRLWIRGDWKGTIGHFCICECDRCFSLPGGFTQIRQAWQASGHIDLHDLWFTSHDGVGFMSHCGDCCTQRLIEIGGGFPTIRELTCPSALVLIAMNNGDSGKQVIITGRDEYGKHISETIGLLPDSQESVSEMTFSHVDAIVKPETAGPVRLKARNLSGSECDILLGFYDSWEVNPAYRRFRFTGRDSSCCPCIAVRAKREWYPLKKETDIVDINIDAIIWAMKAAADTVLGKTKEYATKMLAAEDILKKELADESLLWSGTLNFGQKTGHNLRPRAGCFDGKCM